MKRYMLLPVILLIALILLTGCSSAQKEASLHTEPLVYCSVYPIYDFVSKIGGDRVEVKPIVPFGTEPHGYEPSARQIAEMTKADIIFLIGGGMEKWLDKITESLQAKDIEIVKLHSPTEEDPHIWLDPVLAKDIAYKIKETLVAFDSRNKDYYEKNYISLAERLEKLHQNYANALKTRTSDILITSHDAFGYLATRYGLTTYSLMGISANSETTPAKLAEIIEICKQNGVTTIYAEELLATRAVDVLAAEAGIKILQLNPIGSITREQLKKGEDYFSLMYENLENLKEGLGCDPDE